MPSMLRRLALFILLVFACGGNALLGQRPSTHLLRVFPLAGQVGTQIRVRVGGDNLDGPLALVFSHVGITAQPVLAAANPFETTREAEPNLFDVNIAPNVPAGLHECRVVGRYGVSNSRIFVVAEQPQAEEVEPNSDPTSGQLIPLESGVCGRILEAGDADWFRFPLKAGQTVGILLEASELDSRLDPSLTLFTPDGKELASSGFVRKNATLWLQAAQDGEYAARVQDLARLGSENNFYRLSVSLRPTIQFALPAAVQLGEVSHLKLYGHQLPGGTSATALAGAWQTKELEQRFQVSIAPDQLPAWLLPRSAALLTAPGGWVPVQLDSPRGKSNVLWLGASSLPVAVEGETQRQLAGDRPDVADALDVEPQLLPGGIDVTGRFFPARDLDRFRFDSAAGQAWDLEVLCARLGVPADPRLLVGKRVQTGDGGSAFQVLAESDDEDLTLVPEYREVSRDPSLRFVAPEAGSYEIQVSDRGSVERPDLIYRLQVQPAHADFHLAVVHAEANAAPRDANFEARPRECALLPGGKATLQVLAYRNPGLTGPIELQVEGLPEGIKAEVTSLAPGERQATVVLTAAEKIPPWRGTLQIRGIAQAGGEWLTRTATHSTLIWETRPFNGEFAAPLFRVASGIHVAVLADDPAPFTVQGNLPSKEKALRLAPGVKVQIPFSVTRRNGFQGAVNISLFNPPPKIQAAAVSVAPEATSGVLEVEAAGDAPLLLTHLQLVAIADGTPFRRNAQEAERLKQRQTLLTTKLAELQAALASTQQQQAAKTGELTAADQQVQQLATQRPSLEQELNLARSQATEAQSEVERLRVALAAAEEQFRAREQQVQAQQTRLNELTAQAGAVEAAKGMLQAGLVELMKQLEAVQAQVNQLQPLTQAVTTQAEAAVKAAEPTSIKLTMIAEVLPVEVTHFPVQFQVPGVPVIARPGESAEMSVGCLPEFGFAGEVKPTVIDPLPGWTLEFPATVAGTQPIDVKLLPPADAVAGDYQVRIQCSCDFAGAARSTVLTLPVQVVLPIPPSAVR